MDNAVPRNTKVGPTITLNVEDPDARGSFSLSKPTTDWPVGSYRMELSVNGKLVETLNFTVVEAAAD